MSSKILAGTAGAIASDESVLGPRTCADALAQPLRSSLPATCIAPYRPWCRPQCSGSGAEHYDYLQVDLIDDLHFFLTM